MIKKFTLRFILIGLLSMGALPVSPRKCMKLKENSEKIAIGVYNHQ